MKTTLFVAKVSPTPLPGQDDGLNCEICGARMVQRQCKIRCLNCGYTRDCSDP